MVFLCDPGGNTLAVVAAVRAAGAVSTAALHQEAARPENGIRPLQLLTQRHGEVARSATVQSHLLPQKVEISTTSKTQTRHDQSHILSNLYLMQPSYFLVKNVLPLAFLLWMKDFPSTCHVGLYSSSISTCHRSGSRYFKTSSMVLRPATASDNSSIPCREGGRTTGAAGSDTLYRRTKMERDGKDRSFIQKILYLSIKLQKENVLNVKICFLTFNGPFNKKSSSSARAA